MTLIAVLLMVFMIWSLFDMTSETPLLWKIQQDQEWYWEKNKRKVEK